MFDLDEPTPEMVLSFKPEEFRKIGMSNAKASYVHNVARFAMEKGMENKKLGKMNNEEIITYLTEIKGVGRWTVEMLLMFTLGREDVFAPDDMGIQAAMKNLYDIRITDNKKLRNKLLKISESWSPYRTYACMHLWHYKDSAKK